MVREGNDFINSFVFNMKKGISTYTLKDNNYSLDMNIIVEKLSVSDNNIYVKYIISDTGFTYEYKIEMSECL